MARAGAKPIYTEELANDVLGGLMIGLTQRDAIGSVGISEQTVARWCKGLSGAPVDFGERYARARMVGIRKRVRRLVQLADEGDVRAIEAWLDRCTTDYRKGAAVDVKHSGTVTHEHTLLDAAVRRIADEEGLDVAEVMAEASGIVAEAQR